MTSITQSTVWVWRSGREEERDEWAIEHSFAGGGWDWLPSMVDMQTRDELRQLYQASRPENAAQGEPQHVGQLANIRFDVAVGDVVIMPRTHKGQLAFGIVTAPYTYRESEQDATRRHVAQVDWVRPDFPRDQLSADLSNILNRRGTIFRPRAVNAQERLRALMETGHDPGYSQLNNGDAGERAFLLTWNPDLVGPESDWHTSGRWSSRSRKPRLGDRVYLLRQRNDRGIARSGVVVEEAFLAPHWDPEKTAAGEETTYLGINWDTDLLLPPPLPTDLLNDLLPDYAWNSQYSSGNELPAGIAEQIAALWEARNSLPAPIQKRPARDPKWAIEEQILAFQLYREKYPQSVDEPRVIEVSQQLQELTIHPRELRTPKFRNPNGVSRKLGDIATHAPDYEGKQITGSRLDRETWNVLGDMSDDELANLVNQVLAGTRVSLGLNTKLPRDSRGVKPDLVIRGGFTFGTTRQRRGQREFRNQLLALAGPHCLVTGNDGLLPAQALDACHLYSYAKTGEHLPRGGALMRRDLHTLFDLNLLAIEPDSWTVHLAPSLRTVHAYQHLHGRQAATVWKEHLSTDLLLQRLIDANIDPVRDVWPNLPGENG